MLKVKLNNIESKIQLLPVDKELINGNLDKIKVKEFKHLVILTKI